MEKLNSPENISNLCRAISRMSELGCTKDQIGKYVAVLRLASFGVDGDASSLFYGSRLKPITCVESILHVDGFVERLTQRPEWCSKLVKSVLNISRLTSTTADFLEKTVPFLLNTQLDNTELVQSVFQHKDINGMPLVLIEECVKKEPLPLEILIIKLVTRLKTEKVTADVILKEAEYYQWIKWSSRSSLIFSTVTSILNRMLCLVSCKLVLLGLIRGYLRLCEELCDDATSLYPPSYQSLACVLKLHPDSLPESGHPLSRDYVTTRLGDLEKTNPAALLVLLTHYPHWSVHYAK